MTQWRGDDWPVVIGRELIYTAAENIDLFFHRFLMALPPERYELKQKHAALLIEEILAVDTAGQDGEA